MTETPLSAGPGYVYWAEPPARDAEDVRARHEDNRRAWNEGATRYTSELEETIAFIRGGGSNLHPIERANLGDLRPWCAVAIHLQCASGRDTLSLWNEGAGRVVGVDISDVHIANARLLTEAVGAPGDVVSLRYPRHAARAGWDGRPGLHGPGRALLAARPGRLGRGDLSAAHEASSVSSSAISGPMMNCPWAMTAFMRASIAFWYCVY